MTNIEKDYIKAIHYDKSKFEEYYLSSFSVKTEQQKFLEHLLSEEKKEITTIADIACGAGSLSFHLSKIFPNAKFTLVDLNEDAIALARKNLPGTSFHFICESIYDLSSLSDNSFDMVCCWQTLSWLEKPKVALAELIRIAKPGSKIYVSSLFNTEHDVDLYTKIIDHSTKSAQDGLHYNYNTYSRYSIEKWIGKLVKSFIIVPFNIGIDISFNGRGIGTYTRRMADGSRLQFSAGMLLNWGILIITK
jgi:ubiquinone/menaquinone biosynthesis C-methylase UbiE